MSVAAAHFLYAVNINAAADVLIDQIQSFGLDPGLAEMILGGDGSVYNTFVAVARQAPRASFSTTALKTALDKVPTTGLKINSDNIVEMFLQAADEGGTRKTGANHTKMAINEGLLVPRTLNAPDGSPATLSLEAVATFDGTNDPVTITTGQSLVGSPSVSEIWTCGPVSINGSALTSVQSIDIDFGLMEMVLGSDGLVWPTYASIAKIQPIITITCLDANAINTFGLTGTAQGATDSLLFLTHCSEGGMRVANATATHIRFTIDEGRISVRSVGGSDGEPLQSVVQITPTYDGTNAPIVMNTAVAIA